MEIVIKIPELITSSSLFAGLTLDDSPSEASRSSVSPISSDFPLKNSSAAQSRIPKDSSSTFSHDSGVDSMNTNSSGKKTTLYRSGLNFGLKVW